MYSIRMSGRPPTGQTVLWSQSIKNGRKRENIISNSLLPGRPRSMYILFSPLMVESEFQTKQLTALSVSAATRLIITRGVADKQNHRVTNCHTPHQKLVCH